MSTTSSRVMLTQLLFVSLVVAAVQSALTELPLEEALVNNDECQSSDDDACAMNALQLRGQKQSEESPCMPQDQWCGDNSAQKSCCGENHCVRDGNIFKCKPGGGAHCVPTNEAC